MKLIFTLLTATLLVGCGKQTSTSNHQKLNSTQASGTTIVTWKHDQLHLNFELLSQYYNCIAQGNFPAQDMEARSMARALELVLIKGEVVRPNFHLTMKTRATVPVEIILDGKQITLVREDFSREELSLISLISRDLTLFPSTNRVSDETRGEVRTSPDIGDFF